LRQFYRLNAQGGYEPLPVGPGGVVRSAVLPGFQWRLGDLERQPSLEALIDDPVYQDYVLLDLQQERQRAEQAWQRAEQERQRAEQAERRIQQEQTQVERLTAQLRALGIDPDAQP
jgi:hypothetical protein